MSKKSDLPAKRKKDPAEYKFIISRMKFIWELRATAPDKIHDLLDKHLRDHIRKKRSKADFIAELHKVKDQMNVTTLDFDRKDAFLLWLENQDIDAKPESLLIKELTHDQYENLLSYAIKYKLFKTQIDLSILQALFTGQLNEPLQVNSNIKIACFFEALAPKFISNNWQSILWKSKHLNGSRGKPITNKSYSKSLQHYDRNSDYYKDLKKLVNQLK
jgi:hypothetical protein